MKGHLNCASYVTHKIESGIDRKLVHCQNSQNFFLSDPYSVLYKDDQDLVNEILDNMWEKDIYGDSFKQNLEQEPEKAYDPTTKMKLRHQQVERWEKCLEFFLNQP